jgi:hypothetical protein
MVKELGDIKLIAMGSYRCELFFGYLRMMSHYDNSPDRAKHVIENTVLL